MTTALILRIILVAVCFLVSAVLAYRRTEGWGWCLFVALWLGAVTASSKSDGSSKVYAE